jgi:hypothetical protein
MNPDVYRIEAALSTADLRSKTVESATASHLDAT